MHVGTSAGDSGHGMELPMELLSLSLSHSFAPSPTFPTSGCSWYKSLTQLSTPTPKFQGITSPGVILMVIQALGWVQGRIIFRIRFIQNY